MIKPTVGRIVWYYGSKDLVVYQPLAAVVCFVENDEKVNLHVFGAKGECFPRERVRLVQDLEKSKETDNLPDSEFCAWMPFQRVQPQVALVTDERLMALEASVLTLGDRLKAYSALVDKLSAKDVELGPELGPDGKPKLWVPPGAPGNPLPAWVPPGAPPVSSTNDGPAAKPSVPKQVI